MSKCLLTGLPLIPIGASKKTKEAIRRLNNRYFVAMGKACEFEQIAEIDRAYDIARKDILEPQETKDEV